jgi:PhnB protein
MKEAVMAKAKPIPEGHHSVTPYLIVDNATKALDFYSRALGARETFRMPGPDGKIAHAEIQVGDSRVFLCDETPQAGKSPKTLRGSPVGIFLYTDDVDATYARAVREGATSKMPPTNMFWGDRWSQVVDPYGHEWQFATHVEDVSEEQLNERMAEMAESGR